MRSIPDSMLHKLARKVIQGITRRWRRDAAFLFASTILAVTLSACGPQPAPPTMPRQPTVAQPSQAAVQPTTTLTTTPIGTFPPAWTATFTWTPAPTRTAAPTATPQPTFTTAQLCELFGVLSPPDGAVLPFSAPINVTWRGIPKGRQMRLQIIKDGGVGGGGGVKVEIPFDGNGVIPIPARRLPGSGRYTWRAVVLDPLYGEICLQQGSFVRQRTDWF